MTNNTNYLDCSVVSFWGGLWLLLLPAIWIGACPLVRRRNWPLIVFNCSHASFSVSTLEPVAVCGLRLATSSSSHGRRLSVIRLCARLPSVRSVSDAPYLRIARSMHWAQLLNSVSTAFLNARRIHFSFSIGDLNVKAFELCSYINPACRQTRSLREANPVKTTFG